MSINEHNLNIHLYSLEDLLGLFNLTYDITYDDLKRAKKTVLMTHPDKSKLDSKYFLFYKKAFDIIIRFHDNQNKQRKQVNPQNTIYSTNDDKDSSNTKNVTSIINDMSKKDFQHKFNDLFEKNMSKKIDTTKNEWFQNDESTFKTTENVNASNMGTIFNTIKDKQSGLVRYRGVENLVTKNTNSSNYYDDIEDDDSYVVSDPFSKLKFDDLRKVHKDETVFSVSERDFNKVTTYSSVDQFMIARSNQSTAPMEKQEAEMILAQQDKTYREKMMKHEYASNLQNIQYEEKNKSVLSNFLRIKN
jgi:hypothetical protein|tara:strand:- start:648 stop:1556 length:909 start_codon:yes stop_codon:yes gene_type:complete